MSTPIRHRLAIDVSLNNTFTDEMHADVGAAAFLLSELKESYGSNAGHDLFTQQDLEIWTGAFKTGVKLVEGSDFDLSNEYSTYSENVTTAVGTTKNVYSTITITNGAYQVGTLYFTGEYVGDLTNPIDINNITCEWEVKITDFSISDYSGYKHYFVTMGADKITAELPDPANNENLKLGFTYEAGGSAYGALYIDAATNSGTINGQDYIMLFKDHETVKIKVIDGEWVIDNNWKWHIESGYVSTTTWKNRHLGTIDLNYNNLAGAFEIGETITEAVSGYRGIIAEDTGVILRLWYIDDGAGAAGGFFTNGRQITGGSSGATADVNGNTKGVDSYVFHNLGVNWDALDAKISMSTDGTIANSYRLYAASATAISFGIAQQGVDTNNFIYQTGANGCKYLNTAGVSSEVNDATDYYYNIVINQQ